MKLSSKGFRKFNSIWELFSFHPPQQIMLGISGNYWSFRGYFSRSADSCELSYFKCITLHIVEFGLSIVWNIATVFLKFSRFICFTWRSFHERAFLSWFASFFVLLKTDLCQGYLIIIIISRISTFIKMRIDISNTASLISVDSKLIKFLFFWQKKSFALVCRNYYLRFFKNRILSFLNIFTGIYLTF